MNIASSIISRCENKSYINRQGSKKTAVFFLTFRVIQCHEDYYDWQNSHNSGISFVEYDSKMLKDLVLFFFSKILFFLNSNYKVVFFFFFFNFLSFIVFHWKKGYTSKSQIVKFSSIGQIPGLHISQELQNRFFFGGGRELPNSKVCYVRPLTMLWHPKDSCF